MFAGKSHFHALLVLFFCSLACCADKIIKTRENSSQDEDKNISAAEGNKQHHPKEAWLRPSRHCSLLAWREAAMTCNNGSLQAFAKKPLYQRKAIMNRSRKTLPSCVMQSVQNKAKQQHLQASALSSSAEGGAAP